MTGYQNLHTHTTYCDGTQTPEEMIKAALAGGCASVGFSEHSNVGSVEEKYSMNRKTTQDYIREIDALRDKYRDDIEVFLGLELDYYTGWLPDGFDYIIGALHYISRDGRLAPVDADERNQEQMVVELFGGDYYALAEDYYSVLAGLAKKTNADIIGHFDLITKYNFNGRLFDEKHPRYVSAALDAMEEILKNCRLFEVNTGAMYRIGKPEPYPSAFLLSQLCNRGGEVILTSDSHDAESLCYNFDSMRGLLKACGFKYCKRLTKAGFTDEKL